MMSDHYLLFKSLHIIAIISWMAGMLTLPRLYVYHASATPGSELDLTLQTMERRLLRVILNPAMIASILLGLALMGILGKQGLGLWFHGKMSAILGLVLLHGLFARWRRDFALGRNRHSALFYRCVNEGVTVLMLIAVLLVVYKPL